MPYWKPKSARLEEEMADEKRKWRLYTPIDFLEQLSTTVGGMLTAPERIRQRAVAGEPMWTGSPLPGGKEYEAYKAWKGTPAEPSVPAGIPSWKSWGGVQKAVGLPWAKEYEMPEKYEQARMGMGETAEFVPWLALGGGTAKTATQLLEKGAPLTYKTAPQVIRPTAKVAVKEAPKVAEEVPKAVEEIAPKVAEEVAEPVAITKLKGALDYSLKVQKETRALYREQMGVKAAKMEEAFGEGKGVESYYKSLGALKGKLSKAEFEVPAEFKFTTEDASSLLNEVFAKPKIDLNVFDKEHASTAIMKLAGLVKDKTTGLPVQLQKAEIEVLNAAFPELSPIIQASKTMGTKAWANFIDAANIPRALLASGDLSITFRQLGAALARKPQHLPGVIKTQLKVLFSPKNWHNINETLLADSDVQLFLKPSLNYRLYLAPEPGGKVARLWTREETFQSNLAERLPFIGGLIRASDRAFTGGANYMRGMVAKDYAQMLRKMSEKQGKDFLTDENIEGLARLINVVSGRGDFPKAIRSMAPVANAFLFAPRWIISQLELPGLMFSSNPIVRKEATRTLVQFLAAGSSVVGLATMAGAKTELDPKSSDFGKLIYKDTRFDIWRGYAQWARFMAQFVAGERTITGTNRQQEVERLDTVWRFLQSKGSPILSILVDLLAGENYIGEPMFEGGAETVERELRNRLTPLTAQDIYEAMKTSGSLGAVMAGVAGTMGIGVVSYKTKGEEWSPEKPSATGWTPKKRKGGWTPKKKTITGWAPKKR